MRRGNFSSEEGKVSRLEREASGWRLRVPGRIVHHGTEVLEGTGKGLDGESSSVVDGSP